MDLQEEVSHLDSLILQMAGAVEKNLFYAFDKLMKLIRRFRAVVDFLQNGKEGPAEVF